MNLTDEQKLEMTETIARAAFGLKGMRCLTHTDGSRNILVLPSLPHRRSVGSGRDYDLDSP